MEPLKISIDLDGVLANFTVGFAEVANRLFPGAFPENYDPLVHQTAWDFEECLGISTEDVNAVWDAIRNEEEDFWFRLPHFEIEVQELRRFLIEARNRGPVVVYYVTSRIPSLGQSVHEQSVRWLSKHALFTSRCSLIVKPSGVTKPEIYRTLGISMSIDDYWPNVPVNMPNHLGTLLDRAWNRDQQQDYVVVPTLGSYLEMVEGALVARQVNADVLAAVPVPVSVGAVRSITPQSGE